MLSHWVAANENAELFAVFVKVCVVKVFVKDHVWDSKKYIS